MKPVLEELDGDRVAVSPEYAQMLLTKHCKTCLDHGVVGGFINAENGYHSEPCPECSSEENK